MIKEFIDIITLKSLKEAQDNLAHETDKLVRSMKVNGTPLDQLKEKVKH